MPIPGKTLATWSHHRSAQASKQVHGAIRKTLDNYPLWPHEMVFDRFIQGSYRNATNLRRDSDVDLVVRLSTRIRPRVVGLSGSRLEQSESHITIHREWQSFRSHTMNALRNAFGTDNVTSGRKSLKIAKGTLAASADVVVTVHYEDGLAFFLPDEHRWVVSYPQAL